MCGRFVSVLPAEQIARLFRTTGDLPNTAASWNVAPTQKSMVIRHHPESGERRLDMLGWGLVPHFSKALTSKRPINARAETAATSGMFRSALAKRRCIVPASAFYEWRQESGGKQPFTIARQDGEPLAFAGLWESWKDKSGEVLRSFAILTTTANATMAQLHERMPVILEQTDWPVWLGERKEGIFEALMRPAADDVLRLWKVGRRVNSVRNDGPDLLDPALEPAYASASEDLLDINPA